MTPTPTSDTAELRDLTTKTGDLTSLAIATAGRIQSFAVNNNRVPEAALLASELEEMVSHIDCEAADKSVILNAVAMARFGQLRIRLQRYTVGRRDIGIASRSTRGRSRPGQRNSWRYRDLPRRLRERPTASPSRRLNKRARCPRCYAHKCCSSRVPHGGAGHVAGLMTWLTTCARHCGALNRSVTSAASSPRNAAYGTALLRAENASHDEAIDVLERARTNIQKHKVFDLRAGDHWRRSGDRCRPQRATGRSNR